MHAAQLGQRADMALHFHLELALPNAWWFEMPFPAEYADRPYYKDKFRIDEDVMSRRPSRDWDIRSTAMRWIR